jgi:hypothetical protein
LGWKGIRLRFGGSGERCVFPRSFADAAFSGAAAVMALAVSLAEGADGLIIAVFLALEPLALPFAELADGASLAEGAFAGFGLITRAVADDAGVFVVAGSRVFHFNAAGQHAKEEERNR